LTAACAALATTALATTLSAATRAAFAALPAGTRASAAASNSGDHANRRTRLRPRGNGFCVSKSLDKCGFLIGSRLCVFRIDDPARQRVGNGPWEVLRVLGDGHVQAQNARDIASGGLNRVNPFSEVVERRVFNLGGNFRAGRDLVHFHFAIHLGHGQIAGLHGIASANPDQLADHRQGTPQNSDRQDHLQQRQAGADFWTHNQFPEGLKPSLGLVGPVPS
jgi:hypothetical protein